MFLTAIFFGPVLRGSTFSTVPGHQSAVYPWAALPDSLPDSYPQSDQADLSHPWQTFASEALDAGSFPLWDPHSYAGGYPLFANGQSAFLYPPRLLTALTIDPMWAHDLFSILHVLLAGLLMYALMREFTTGTAGSLLAAVSWMFGGFNMAWLHLEVVTPMSVFLPLVLLCVHRSFRLRSATSTAAAGLALGGCLISGHLVLLGIVYLVGAGYAVALALGQAMRGSEPDPRRRFLDPGARLAAMIGVSVASAAIVLVPTALVLSDSQRDPFTYGELTASFLAPPATFLHTFAPPSLPITQLHMHEMTFVGTITGLLAIVGLFVRRRGSWLGRFLVVSSFAIAVGGPATWLAYHFIPGFNIFRPYSRLVVFWSFGVALLGGFGLDALTSRQARAWARRLGPNAALALSLTAVVGTAAQVMKYGRDINPPFVSRSQFPGYPATPLIKAIEAEVDRPNQWPGRILPVRSVAADGQTPQPILFAAESLEFGFDTTGGYDSAVPRRVTALIRLLQGEDIETVISTGLPSAYAPTFLSSQARLGLAARLGVSTIVATPVPNQPNELATSLRVRDYQTVYTGSDGFVLRIVDTIPGPRVVHHDEIIDDEGDALRRFVDPTFDFEQSVVFEPDDLQRAGYRRLRRSGEGRVTSSRRGINTASLRAESTEPAWVVIPTSWSSGWSATVNGKPAKVSRANYAQQAVRIPAGASVVRLRYRPAGLVQGAAVSSATLLGCALLPLVLRLRRHRLLAHRPSESGPDPARR